MRQAAQHAHDAAQNYINALKTARKDYEDACHVFYARFIAGHEIPTKEDADHYKLVVAEMAAFASYLHSDVDRAAQGFGGPSDTTIHPQSIGVQTVTKKVPAHH